MENNIKWKGCWQFLLGLCILGAVANIYENYTFDINKLEGNWLCSTTNYNPFSMGSTIQKGRYPVNYLLEIKNDHSYKLYYGSPGFEKYKISGNINKKIWSGIIISNFNAQDNKNTYLYIKNVEYENMHIKSFCIESDQNGDQCSFRFVKNKIIDL